MYDYFFPYFKTYFEIKKKCQNKSNNDQSRHYRSTENLLLSIEREREREREREIIVSEKNEVKGATSGDERKFKIKK